MSYQEYRQSLNYRLSDKVERELEDFREEIQGKPPEEIYNAAHQIAIKNDIADCFFDADFSPQEAKVLMKTPNLLQGIYEEWTETEHSHMEDLRQTIESFKDYMVKTEKMLSGKDREVR